MIQLFILLPIFMIFSCSHNTFNKAGRAPSWVEGVRNGEESLRVINGNRVFFRRILSQKQEHPDETCSNVLRLVQRDLANESIDEIIVPHSLEYLLFDHEAKECAVTISVGTDLLSKISAIKSMKDKFLKEKEEINKRYQNEIEQRKVLELKIGDLQSFILKNRHLLEKLNNLSSTVESIRKGITEDRDRVRNSFYTGMSRNQLRKIAGKEPSVAMHGVDLCYRHFRTFYSSPHGNVHVCWTGDRNNEFLAGICDVRENRCFTRDP